MFKPLLKNMGMICITKRLAILSLSMFLCLDTYAQVTAIYWTDAIGIHKANIDGSGHETLFRTTFKTPVKMATDPLNQHIYWIDEGLGEIRRANLDGSQIETVLETGDFPRAIALDVNAGKMYWTEFGMVKRSNLDGTGEEDVASTPGFLEGIALDLSAGKMYWTARNAGIIRKSDLDGTEIETIAGGILRPNGLALDIPSGKVYWASASGIARANTDGTEEEILVTVSAAAIDIQLNLESGKMYWTEPQNQKILRSNLDGSNVEDLTPPGLARPTSIFLDAESESLYWLGGSESSIRRSNLDVTTTEILIPNEIRTPLGIALDHDAGKMYWADGEASRLQRANLDGSELESVLEFAFGYPDQIFLDLDNSKIYWSDQNLESNFFTLRRANLDGSELEELGQLEMGIYAVDVVAGKVYGRIGLNAGSRTIVRQNLDGSEREELVVGVRLTDLALDVPDGKFYWTEGADANIKRANLDGTEAEEIFSLSSRLNDVRRIAFDAQEKKVYWVNDGANMEEIWRSNPDGVLGQDGGLREYLITSPILQSVQDFALSYEDLTSTAISATEPSAKTSFAQPYPNPFASSITLEIENSQSGDVRLDIYDMLGRRVATLFDGVLPAGTHHLLWQAASAPPGVYMARIQQDGYMESRRITKVK